jgi:hypothetical protein
MAKIPNRPNDSAGRDAWREYALAMEGDADTLRDQVVTLECRCSDLQCDVDNLQEQLDDETLLNEIHDALRSQAADEALGIQSSAADKVIAVLQQHQNGPVLL